MVTHGINYSKMRNFPRSRSCAFQFIILHATCLLISPALSTAEADAAQQLRQHAPEVRALMEWFEQQANSFNRKQHVRREFPDNPTSAIGVFAAEDISEGEILFSLPWNAMINDQRTAGAKGADAPDEGAIECNTVRNLIDEMKLGDESKYAPYVKYLMNQRAGQLPSAWSKEGKALLFEVLGGVNTLPPKHPYHWISDDWHQGCKGGSDSLEENAAMLVVQRAEDDLMIPLYDMYNHRNGHYHNTINHRVDGKEFYMTASRDIVKGEQIYNSYNLCSGCAGRKGAYGTAEIFRDYGFIEQYPQRWIFPEINFAFQVEEEDDHDDNDSKLRVRWGRKGPPSQEAIEFIQKHAIRLERFKKITKDDPELASIPAHELDSIVSYVEAIAQGMKLVLKEMAIENSSFCALNDSCLPTDGYDVLLDEIDELPYEGFVTCEPSDIVDVNAYVEMEKTQSAYQEIGFFGTESRDDVCFELDGTTQICTNYRPHYHELMVHAPASYIKAVRRVAFVGGGDSMLLHEVLKYPTLELVVGLELDQVVVRKSFQHFYTQPHFGDDKVEWWFGDAAKSLLVLPREYFGSFDLVLVDLSETVMSFSVTNKLDMLQSLALLLNDSGIMVKNELYLEKMNTLFDYTAQIYYPNVPFLCDQIMVMGSNRHDFLKEVPVHHGVEMKLLSSEEVSNFSKYFHDYNDNAEILRDAKRANQMAEIDYESDQQGRRAGILLVVDVGNINLPITPVGELKTKVNIELEELGLNVLGPKDLSSDDTIIVLHMQEGYVTIRVWPDQKYCALDIHLWSSFNKMEQLRDALVKALGSDHSSLSSYRIVTGGMKGTRTWDEDHKTIGPLIEKTRSCDGVDYVKEGDLNSKETNDIVMDEALNLIQGNGALAAVLCGPTKEDCKSLDAVSRHKSVDEVIFIPTCPELAAASEFSENIGDLMVQCEKEVLVALRAATSKGGISAIVVDPSAPVTMLKIASSIWSSQRNLERLLAKQFTFIVPINGQHESQRKRHNLLDRIRKVIKFDPLHAAEINVSGLDELTGLGILARDDGMFFRHLRTAVMNIENRSDLTITTRRITGGLWRYLDKDTYLPKVYSANDYDSQPARDQFRSQIFYGRQIVAQYTLGREVKASELRRALNQTIGSMVKNGDTQVLSYEIGDGLVASSTFQKGSIVLVWDGVDRLDINLFLYRNHEAQMSEIMAQLAEALPKATLSLRDEQPRGINVVTLMENVK